MSSPQPFLRWAGSKRQLVKTLATYWSDDFERYVEPFAGSACLFFHLNPSKAILADINPQLIATYTEIKRHARDVTKFLKTLRKSERTYYSVRAAHAGIRSKARRAAMFIYLNRCCFNGLYRTNLRGEFNVPYGGEGSGELPSSDTLKACSKSLSGAQLLNADFETTLDLVEAGDFVYMDPPFSVSAKRVFKEYSPTVFAKDDLKRLRKRLERLADERIHFLVSYLDSSEGDALARGFRVRRVNVRRNISGFIKRRSTSREVLISYP